MIDGRETISFKKVTGGRNSYLALGVFGMVLFYRVEVCKKYYISFLGFLFSLFREMDLIGNKSIMEVLIK